MNAGTTTITVRGLDLETKRGLRMRAAAHGHSMEEEVRQILARAAAEATAAPADLGAAIAAIVDPIGGVELDIPKRGVMSAPPGFDWPEGA